MSLKHFLVLIFVSLISFTACNKDDKNNAPESKDVIFYPTSEDIVVGQADFTTEPPRVVEGKAIVYKNSFYHILRFENFSIDNGPDLKVYLSVSNTHVDEYINLGDLQAASGNFNYTYSVNTDMNVYKHIVVYSESQKAIYCVASL